MPATPEMTLVMRAGDPPRIGFGSRYTFGMPSGVARKFNVASREPRPLAGFESGRNCNPEFGADGTLYFLSTPDGIPNVYRLPNPMRLGSPARRTNVTS